MEYSGNQYHLSDIFCKGYKSNDIAQKLNNLMAKATKKNERVENVEMVETTETTPMIPRKLYDKIPELLKEACSNIPDGRQKDVMLLSTISILGGCIRGVKGRYQSATHYTNINSFIIAPPASGKGVMNYASSLGNKLHETLLKKSDTRWSTNREGENPVLFIPGSASKVAIVNHLKDSRGCGIICETEADTLESSMKNKWGDFSDVMRKAFHHEPISHTSRNDGYSYIRTPRLSTILTGTPNQIHGLIPSQENGLLSRFLYYIFDEKEEWRDGFLHKEIDSEEYYDGLSNKVLELSKFSIDNPTLFEFTKKQEDEFNKYFKKKYDDYFKLLGAHGSSIVKRMAINFFRIAMILNELDRFSNKDKSKKMVCSKKNFNIVLDLVDILLKHSFEVSSKLRTNEVFDKHSEFLNGLQKEFTRKEATEVAGDLVTNRTIDNWLNELISKGRIAKISHGRYSKKE